MSLCECHSFFVLSVERPLGSHTNTSCCEDPALAASHLPAISVFLASDQTTVQGQYTAVHLHMQHLVQKH